MSQDLFRRFQIQPRAGYSPNRGPASNAARAKTDVTASAEPIFTCQSTKLHVLRVLRVPVSYGGGVSAKVTMHFDFPPMTISHSRSFYPVSISLSLSLFVESCAAASAYPSLRPLVIIPSLRPDRL